MVGEEENCHYNVQLVSVIYNNELKEHLDELGELKNTLAEDGKAYSDTTRSLNSEDKFGQIKEMKEYIEQALANIAYSVTHATQKIDDGLKMQTDDIENLSGRVAELTAELDIKKEMKNRVSIGELSVVKRKPWRSTIKIVDDPQSPWKMPRQKFRRQALDYTILDHIGVIGANSDGSKEVDTRTARRSRVLSVGSRDSLRFGALSVKSGNEGRTGLGTMRKGKIPLVKRQTQDRRIIVEEEEEEEGDSGSRPLKLSLSMADSCASLKSTDTEGSSRPPTPGTPLTSPLVAEPPEVSRKISYRLSTLPPIPDDFMTSLEVNKPQEEIKVKRDTKNNSAKLPVGNFVKKVLTPFDEDDDDMKNPFDDDDTDDNDESFADALPAPPDTDAGNERFDISTLPPPPPSPTK